MNKTQAIQDAKDRTEKTGLTWCVLRIRTEGFIPLFNKYTYDTVTEHHKASHVIPYATGKFKIVYICRMELETELNY